MGRENRCFPTTCWGGVPSDVQKTEYSAGVRTIWALWSARGRIEREKKLGIGQIVRISGANVARERLGSLPAHGWKQNTPKNARWVGYHPVGRLVSLRSRVRLGAARARCVVFGWRGACSRGRKRLRQVDDAFGAGQDCQAAACRMVRGRPRLRCCRRTPRPCWLPRRCATS